MHRRFELSVSVSVNKQHHQQQEKRMCCELGESESEDEKFYADHVQGGK